MKNEWNNRDNELAIDTTKTAFAQAKKELGFVFPGLSQLKASDQLTKEQH